MSRELSRAFRLDIAPHYQSDNIRVLEGRDGLLKQDGKLFKQALKLTKKSPDEACDIWRDMMNRYEATNVSVVYNVGLCAEHVGDLESAMKIYSRAIETWPSEKVVRKAIDRIYVRNVAEADYQKRQSTEKSTI